MRLQRTDQRSGGKPLFSYLGIHVKLFIEICGQLLSHRSFGGEWVLRLNESVRR